MNGDKDESQRPGDEKIRQLGWILLFLWIFMICWITKEYWFPGWFSNAPEKENIVSRMRRWRGQSEKKTQKTKNQLQIQEKQRQVDFFEKLHSDSNLYLCDNK